VISTERGVTEIFMSGGQLILLTIAIMGIGVLIGRYWFPKTGQ
jgi:hypothetical protein